MSGSRLHRSFQALILALLGLFLLNKLWNGTVLWYINSRFLPLTVIGAFGLLWLARFTLTCCVADAAAIGMIVRWPAAAELATNGWVRVQGPVQLGELEGRRMPVIEAHSVEAVPPPDRPYIYN